MAARSETLNKTPAGAVAPARTTFNPVQTFSYGPYVRTVMDAHFDPYAEGLPRPDRTKEDMEAVARMVIPPGPARK